MASRFGNNLKHFAWVNKEGAIVGLIIGAIFAFFPPLYVLSVLVFSYLSPIEVDFLHVPLLKILLPLIGMGIGVLIDSLIAPNR